MKLRTTALMLALAFGFGTMAEARTKPAVHKVKKPKRPKPPKAPKRAKVKHARHV